MEISQTHDPHGWDEFIISQPWKPFLQSWTMGDVYADIGQRPIRITAHDSHGIRGVCFGHVVLARRGKHLSVPYGPIIDETLSQIEVSQMISGIVHTLKTEAKRLGCSFIRFSPFWPQGRNSQALRALGGISSPLHLLAEHVWYLPLEDAAKKRKTEEELLANMRKTTRNLIRRAEKDGVTIMRSTNALRDLPEFLSLHDETRKRHGFTAYTDEFFRSQVTRFSTRKECTLYRAKFQGKTIAASIHMHAFGETSYHHGASSNAFQKIPASYLLQWTAICDALQRGDRIYNFWGIAPLDETGNVAEKLGKHPFGGVTLFKTGFGGHVLNLVHCTDVPVTSSYWLTHAFEKFRKYRRGF